MTHRYTIIAAFILCVSCHPHYVLNENMKGNSLDYSSSKPDSTLSLMVNPYKVRLDAEMNSTVGYLAENLEKGYPEGKLGNFAADVFFEQAMKQFNKENSGTQMSQSNSVCMMNNGGLRVNLQKGLISKGKIFEMLPFENYLTVFQFKGKYLVNELAQYIYDKKGQPVSHNALLVFENGKLLSFELAGKAVDTSKVYLVITNDYLANGGDNMELFGKFKNDVQRKDYSELKLRDCMINYIQSNSSINDSIRTKGTGRVVFK